MEIPRTDFDEFLSRMQKIHISSTSTSISNCIPPQTSLPYSSNNKQLPIHKKPSNIAQPHLRSSGSISTKKFSSRRPTDDENPFISISKNTSDSHFHIQDYSIKNYFKPIKSTAETAKPRSSTPIPYTSSCYPSSRPKFDDIIEEGRIEEDDDECHCIDVCSCLDEDEGYEESDNEETTQTFHSGTYYPSLLRHGCSISTISSYTSVQSAFESLTFAVTPNPISSSNTQLQKKPSPFQILGRGGGKKSPLNQSDLRSYFLPHMAPKKPEAIKGFHYKRSKSGAGSRKRKPSAPKTQRGRLSGVGKRKHCTKLSRHSTGSTLSGADSREVQTRLSLPVMARSTVVADLMKGKGREGVKADEMSPCSRSLQSKREGKRKKALDALLEDLGRMRVSM
ncbi:hypothetical protein BKA69DRAFT_1063861 [Paraphysoderma sedebokerense]|nr:hypothetical protein BKA69DRAFT_1063861 [Paraphysoderma sedebokerense]